MRAIDRFILHVVHNWVNNLNEAYSPKAMEGFIEKFKQEAEDLNININDAQLKKYIERFDILKNSPKIQEKDLNKLSLSQLIKIVSSSAGADVEEEDEEITPDVVYHDDNGITIWNGNSDQNCLTYGRGERWCITRGSWAGHRYSADKKYPTFYLAKNSNLPDSDPLSFIVIQVRDTYNEGSKYVLHPRTNNPHYPPPISFSGLVSEAPWLANIPNLRNILRYIPLSSTEKATQLYSREPISIREWIKLPFNAKKQYLIARSNRGKLFSDINISDFISKYLPKYPQLATFIAITPNIIDANSLLRNIEYFNRQDQTSIIENLHSLVSIQELSRSNFSFDLKKVLVYKNKWNTGTNERLYVTKDKSTIVKLTLSSNDISIGLYQEEDDYPNIKLNKRTAKYLLEYPDLDRIPVSIMVKLVGEGTINKETINNTLTKAENDPNSALRFKQVEDGKILLDSNTFKAYKVSNDNISPISFENEDVQDLLNSSINSAEFQINVILKLGKMPDRIDMDISVLKRMINLTPYDRRTIFLNNKSYIVLASDDNDEPIIAIRSNLAEDNYEGARRGVFGYDNRGDLLPAPFISLSNYRVYFEYLRQTNQFIPDNIFTQLLNNQSSFFVNSKKAFLEANPPLEPNSPFLINITDDNRFFIINTNNPTNSYELSTARNNLKGASINPSRLAAIRRSMAGGAGEGEPQAQTQTPSTTTPQGQTPQRGRGRPPGSVANVRAPQPTTPPAPGDRRLSDITNQYNLTTEFSRLPQSVLRKFRMDGTSVNINNNRGASRRNNYLGNAGRVVANYAFGPSDVYIIRLRSGIHIASIVVQPGNAHYIIVPNTSPIALQSSSDLLNALTSRNISEVHRFITNEYFSRNPHHLTEFKQLLRKHINEKKKK
jgi:hypothetical protein